MVLYRSKHFMLTEIRSGGKKNVGGVLCFEGLPSVYGSHKEVLALEEGIVIFAGRNNDERSREHRLGIIVRITGHNGVIITYGRLACRMVKEGEVVRAGQVIGIQGDTGAGVGEYLTLEFRRNGRRIDGCSYLGISRRQTEFCPPSRTPAEIVSRACNLTDNMRVYIDCAPESSEIWRRLLSRIVPDAIIPPDYFPESDPPAPIHRVISE